MKAYRSIKGKIVGWTQKYPDVFCLLLMLVIVAVVLWPITFFYGSLKWDKIDTTLPWFTLLSDIHRAGEFPFWNPYQQLGYPIYGDLQNPLWNPAFYFFLKIVNFNYGWFHFMEIMIYWGASSGMYYLLRYFGLSRRAAVVFGLSYGLSGFMIGRGQNLISNLGGLWMPFALLHILSFLRKPTLKNSFYMAFFLGLQVTGGYQALTILLVYLVLFLGVGRLVQWLRFRQYPILDMLKYGVVGVIVTLILCGFTLYVFYDVYPYITRSEGLSDDWLLVGAFPMPAMENFLIPSYTMVDSDFFGSGASFRNLYFGLFGVLFFLLGLVQFKKFGQQLQIIFVFGCICFVASWGDFTPFRLWLAHHLPLLDTFRFPFFFAWFFIVAAIIIGAKGFDSLMNKEKTRKLFRGVFIAFTLGVLMITINHFSKTGWPEFQNFEYTLQYWGDFLWALNRNELGLLNGVIQVLLLSITLVLIYIFKWNIRKVVSGMIVFDLFLALNFLGPFTYYDTNIPPKKYSEVVNRHPDDFPVPDLVALDTLQERGWKTLNGAGIWRNFANFTRTPDEKGFTSFFLKNMGAVEADYPYIIDTAVQNPVVYWADSVTSVGTFEELYMVNRRHVAATVEHGYRSVRAGTITLEKFDPTGIQAQVKTPQKNLLVIQQSKFKRWRAYIDGAPTSIKEVNGFMMGIEVPKGDHQIKLSFYSGILVPFFYFNTVVWFLSIVLLIILEVKKWRTQTSKSM